MWENDLWTVRFPYLSVILQEGKCRWRKMLTLPCWCGFVWQLRFLFLFWFAWQVWHWVLQPDQQGGSPPWPYRDPYAHHARSVTPSQMTLSQYGHGEHGKVSVHHLLWFHVFPFTFMFLFLSLNSLNDVHTLQSWFSQSCQESWPISYTSRKKRSHGYHLPNF